MSERIYPLFFVPVYKDYIWGGERIPALFKRSACPKVCAESWEISDRPEGMSIVSNGMLSGATLHQVVESMPVELLGKGRSDRTFPLLLKIIDAHERLSVQVHPDDAQARQLSAEAKTELWYILSAEPGARVFAGFNTPTTPSSFESALAEQRVNELLRSVPVEAGDAIYLPGGTVHAIGEGCLILEVQQNSNTTYRVYDWNRVDKNGKPRELHVAEAMKAIHWDKDCARVIKTQPVEKPSVNSIHTIISCQYFTVARLRMANQETVENDGSGFHMLFVAGGAVIIHAGDSVQRAETGTSCLIPAAIPEYRIQPAGGKADLIRISPTPPAL